MSAITMNPLNPDVQACGRMVQAKDNEHLWVPCRMRRGHMGRCDPIDVAPRRPANVSPDVAHAIARLREANGPGGRSLADVLVVCEAAERGVPREIVRAIANYVQNSVTGVPQRALLEMLEDALGEELL